MALKDLNAAAMLAVAAQWLNQDRATLESQPALIHPVNLVDGAYRTLLTTQERVGSTEQRIVALTQGLGAEDAYHDRKLRGIFMTLTGAAEIADTPEKAEKILGVRDALVPLGLSATQRTFREQAGNGKLAREQFTPEIKALCDTIIVDGQPLSDIIEDWLSSAKRIGDMNAERNRISGDGDDGVAAGELHRARLGWIRAVNAMLTMFDFTDFDADTRRRLLADLRDAEARAARSRTPRFNDIEEPLAPEVDQPHPV